MSAMFELPDMFPFDNLSSCSNNSNGSEFSLDVLALSEESRNEAIVYALMFVLALAGNVPVFASLLNRRRRKSRVDTMILHLTIADLIVGVVMIPLEISWRITVEWLAGDFLCRVFLLVRAFGPYLSSMILVCISLDRYSAIVHPLRVTDARHRAKIMLGMAWTISFLCSVPQSIIFHVESHPVQTNFRQCVSFNIFRSEYHKVAYNLFCMGALYGAPLLIISFCYASILRELWKRSNRTNNAPPESTTQPRLYHLRLSDVSKVIRARDRTLKMTIVIVLTFICCWTPYVVINLWYLFDSPSAEKLNYSLQTCLFMFAVSNSCLNPIVYGSYCFDFSSFFRNACGGCLSPCCAREGEQDAVKFGGDDLDPVANGETYLEMRHATPVRRPVIRRKKEVDLDDGDDIVDGLRSHSRSDTESSVLKV